MKNGRSLFVLMLLMVSFLFVPVSVAGPQTAVSASPTQSSGVYPSIFSAEVNHPPVAYTGQNITVYVNLTYGFQNYNLSVYFAGQNLTGMSPINTYHQYSANKSYFKFSLVMPSTPQMLILLVAASATAGSYNVTYTGQSQISVKTPLVLHAEVINPTLVPIRDAKLLFLIDGNLVSTKTVSIIPARGSVNVNVSLVLAAPLSKGKHTITVEINSSVALINNAGSTYSSAFYYGTPPSYTWIYYVAAVVVAFMALMVFASGRRRPASGGPKWRK